MIKPTAKLDRRSLNRVNRSLERIVKATGRSMKSVVKQTMVFCAQSLVRKTGPGKGKPSKLPKKYKFRPIEKMPDDEHWYVDKDTNYLFNAEKKLAGKAAKGLRKAKGIKYWDKTKNAFGYMPTKATKKYDTSDKRTRIKHAGAAKAGWLGVYALMGKSAENTTIGTKYSRFGFSSTKTTAGALLSNLVDYTRKRWPNAHRRALRKAENRMVKNAQKQIDRNLQNVS